jgi:hypothetical protein
VLVGQALCFHVPGPVQVPLDEALAVAERRGGLADRRLVQLGNLLEGAGDLEPAPAAAEGRLDRDRQTVLAGEVRDLFRAADRALTLSPSATMAAGGGPIQVRPLSVTAWAKAAFSARNP